MPRVTRSRTTPTKAALRLHLLARRHNWDRGLLLLESIVADPKCDRGTALMIYWMGHPNFERQFATDADIPAFARKDVAFLRRLEQRLLADDFPTARIAFDPRSDPIGGPDDPKWDWVTPEPDRPLLRAPPPEALTRPVVPPTMDG